MDRLNQIALEQAALPSTRPTALSSSVLDTLHYSLPLDSLGVILSTIILLQRRSSASSNKRRRTCSNSADSSWGFCDPTLNTAGLRHGFLQPCVFLNSGCRLSGICAMTDEPKLRHRSTLYIDIFPASFWCWYCCTRQVLPTQASDKFRFCNSESNHAISISFAQALSAGI